MSKKPAAAQAKPKRIGTPDLIKIVAEKLPMASKATVQAVINQTLATIADEFKAGTIVALKDFGKFELKNRPARKGRNPATGETIDVPAKIVPKFTFAAALKD
jgi:DNA-binding protein HU-beta